MENSHYPGMPYRRNRVAKVLDAVTFGGFVFVSLRLLFRQNRLGIWTTLFFSLAAVVLLLLHEKHREERGNLRLRNRIAAELRRNRLLLMPTDRIAGNWMKNDDAVIFCAEAELDDVLPHLRNGKTTLWFCGSISPTVSKFIDGNKLAVTLKENAALCERIGLTVSEPEIDEAVRQRTRRRRSNRGNRIGLLRICASKYLLLAFVLLLASFFVRFSVYFRLLSSLSFLFAGIVAARRRAEITEKELRNL